MVQQSASEKKTKNDIHSDTSTSKIFNDQKECKYIIDILELLGCILTSDGHKKWIREDNKKYIEEQERSFKSKAISIEQWAFNLILNAYRDPQIDKKELEKLYNSHNSEGSSNLKEIVDNGASEIQETLIKNDENIKSDSQSQLEPVKTEVLVTPDKQPEKISAEEKVPKEQAIQKMQPVEFYKEAGEYYPPVTVSMKSKMVGADIYYTLDGTEPDQKSSKYSESFNITTNSEIKARSYKQGWEPSEISSVTYSIKTAEWKNLEPADKTDDPVDHFQTGSISNDNGWRAIAGSARGKLHAHNGTWRDDSFKMATEGNWTIIAVSDGMGSAPKSRVGSKAACDAAVDYLLTELHGYSLEAPIMNDKKPTLGDRDMEKVRNRLVESANRAKQAIIREAANRKLELKQFASTFLLCIHCPWGDTDFTAAIQVGDGCIAMLRDQDKTAALLTDADHGEFSSQTRPITEKNIEHTFASRIKASITRMQCIAIMTDGISDDFFPEEQRISELFTGENILGMTSETGKPVNGILKEVIKTSNPEESLLNWMKYEKKQSTDDRTMVLLYRRDI